MREGWRDGEGEREREGEKRILYWSTMQKQDITETIRGQMTVSWQPDQSVHGEGVDQ